MDTSATYIKMCGKGQASPMPERHLGKLLVTESLMAQAFYSTPEGYWFRVLEGVPEGAEFRGQAYDMERNCFVFFYAHLSFPLIEEGKPIEYIIPVTHGSLYMPPEKEVRDA